MCKEKLAIAKLIELGYSFDGLRWNPPEPSRNREHPTNPATPAYDIRYFTPPKGAELICYTAQGRLIISTVTEDTIAWGYKLDIPESVKERRKKCLLK
jgi:hypothetical protein